MHNEPCGLFTREGASIPLTSVEAKGDIIGRSARVKILQHFRNIESKAVEAIYKFPLPEGSSICGFRAVIGEKIIQGVIEEREKAFELYDKALSKGHGGYLLDEERPNLFTLSLGNLNPGTSATAEVDYVILLDANGSEVRFFLPTTISPRYLPPDTRDEKGIPVNELVNPPVALDVSYGLNISLDIRNRENIQLLESPSHPVSTTFKDDSVKVQLTADSTRIDRDFILNIKYKNAFETTGYLCHKDEESFIQLDFSPKSPSELAPSSLSEQEIIFVLDCSGSMEGSSITEAKRALSILLKALEMGTRFNIYRFGSAFSSLFNSSVPYNPEQLDIALKYLSGISADLGGTEILAPLMAIQQKILPETISNIILLTDGQVGNEEQIADLVRAKKGLMRMFTVGIGNGPNEYFIKQLARITGGTSELISPGERIEPKILRLFAKVSSTSSILDCKVDWGTEVTATDIPSPAYYGETVSIFAKLNGDKALPDKVILSGITNKSRQEWIARIARVDTDNSPIPFLWARTKIREYEESDKTITGSQQSQRKEEKANQAVIALSRKYGIISRATSFVAIEKRHDMEKTSGEAVLRKVPVMLTDGWGNLQGIASVGGVVSVDASPSFLRIPTVAIRRSIFRLQKSGLGSGRQASYDLSAPGVSSDSGLDDSLLNILALQKAAGGFEIDSAFAQTLKVSLSYLRDMASKIQVKGKTDKFVLLSTAIVLNFLEYRFADRKASWESIIQKSRKWLEKHIVNSDPTLEGTKLLDWVSEFLKKQNIEV